MPIYFTSLAKSAKFRTGYFYSATASMDSFEFLNYSHLKFYIRSIFVEGLRETYQR